MIPSADCQVNVAEMPVGVVPIPVSMTAAAPDAVTRPALFRFLSPTQFRELQTQTPPLIPRLPPPGTCSHDAVPPPEGLPSQNLFPLAKVSVIGLGATLGGVVSVTAPICSQ